MAEEPKLALDRRSTRTKDLDGRLHVDLAPITKAAINPYYGREIPGWDKLGLDPNKIYRLFRDPEEIKKAAATFNRLPLLATHAATSAESHPTDNVVGSTGEKAAFDGDYLRNSLVVWRQDAIDGIEDSSQKELSCGYHYVPDMTPGEWNGQPYDGRMTEIVGNHLALVKEGRAGPDVVVGDSNTIPHSEAEAASGSGVIDQPAAIERMTIMAKAPVVLSRKAAFAYGAMVSAVQPKLAADSKIDLMPAFAGVTAQNFKSKKAAIVSGVVKAMSGVKLAKDENLDGIKQAAEELVDKIENVEAGDPAPATDDDDPVETLRALSDDPEKFRAAVEALLKRQEPDGDEPPAKDAEEDKAAPAAKDEDKGNPNMVTKAAMDAALVKVRTEATKDAMKLANDIRTAEREVEPVVGVLSGAFDSAGAVYAAALDARGVDRMGVTDPKALQAMFAIDAKNAAAPRPRPVAMDAKLSDDFSKRFPNAGRLKAV